MFRGIGQYFEFKIEAKVASWGIPFFSEDRATHPVDPPSDQTPPRHELWSKVLRRHLNRRTLRSIPTNTLDYAAMATDGEYLTYLDQLADPDALTGLTPNEELALWINAYNALCAGLVVQHFNREGELPNSITDLRNSKDGPVWDQPAGKVAARVVSLADIEHQVVRRRWRTPLVHACLVCASTSCPDLRGEAFEAGTLQRQMEDSMRMWLQNNMKGSKRLDEDELVLSRIFLWYSPDFGNDRFDAVKYVKTMGVDHGSAKPSRLSYFEYDWGLNHSQGRGEAAAGEDLSGSELDGAPNFKP